MVRNFLANVGGQLLGPLLSVLLVPLYLRYLGLAGYGVVAFFWTVVGLLAIFSNGLGWALQREIARRDSDGDRPTLPNLLRTFELVYWLEGAFLGVTLSLLASPATRHWLRLDDISPETIHRTWLVVSLRIALAFPTSVYLAAYIGLQRQVAGNAVVAISVLVGSIATAIVVIFTRSVLFFFVTDLVNAGVFVFFLRRGAWSLVSRSGGEGRFDFQEVRALWRFSLQLVWIHAVAVVVKQADRLAVSKFLPVAALGIYSVGTAAGRLLGLLYNPYLTAVYPETCRIAREGDVTALGEHVRRNASVLTAFSLSVGLPLALFAPEILAVWTRNDDVVRFGSGIMALYVVGSMFLSPTGAFYQGQTALGVTRHGIAFNTAAAIWYPLAVGILVWSSGLRGAAWSWMLYGFAGWIYFLATSERHFLARPALWAHLRDVALAATGSVAVVWASRVAARHLFPVSTWSRILFGVGGAIGAFALGTAIMLGADGVRAVIQWRRSPN